MEKHGKYSKRHKAIVRRRIFLVCIASALAICVAMLGIIINAVIKSSNSFGVDSDINSSQSEEAQSETVDPNKVVATATVVNTGDIILHSTVLDGAKTADGNYDFSAFFTAAQDYFKKADLATANFEVTLGGTESGAFSGYPAFNSPDTLTQ